MQIESKGKNFGENPEITLKRLRKITDICMAQT
jgi:hypothetical protein